MRLAADLAEASGEEVAKIAGERDPHAEGEGRGARGAGATLGLREKTVRDAVPAKIGVNGNPPDIESVVLPRGQQAADEPAISFRDDHSVVGKGLGDGLSGLAERAGFRFELAAIFLEGGADEVGDRRALRERRGSDGDLA